ncbi:MAG: hypothetical protein QOE66_3054 [Chloroflexota bacterium]|nr:hypothetical protein [Chloroflexota bacterium]
MVEQFDPQAARPAADPSPTPEGPQSIDAGWTPPPPASANEARFRDWMAQLQTMIDGVATSAAPHVREIAAKAAELAAKAGDAAGPFATRAAAATSDVGQKVAAKSRDFAADMRRIAGGDATTDSNGNGHGPGAEASAAPTATATADPIVETPFTESSDRA